MAFYLGARGYQVFQAGNGKAAIQNAITGNPDFILLDLRLPDINGVEVARTLRNTPRTQHIPIIGWSAESGSKLEREMLLRAGIVDYFQKPIRLADLDGMIERFVPKSH